MPLTCEWCREPIAFLDAQTSSGRSAWHTRCWNQAAEEQAEFRAEFDNGEGFAFRALPDELAMSETGSDRSEVIPIMATAPAATDDIPRGRLRSPKAIENRNEKGESKMNEIVKFPINTPVEVTLQCEVGKHVDGRYGDQVMYSLVDGAVMYVPLYVEQRFRELAIGAGGDSGAAVYDRG